MLLIICHAKIEKYKHRAFSMSQNNYLTELTTIMCNFRTYSESMMNTYVLYSIACVSELLLIISVLAVRTNVPRRPLVYRFCKIQILIGLPFPNRRH
jgi:hypothetical protein